MIVDSPWMQRLREIKQMGTANRTYVSANNTRFEHSLGVCHLAGEMLGSLEGKCFLEDIVNKMEKDGVTYKIFDSFSLPEKDRKDILKQVVRLVALLHDVGHGPFSHVSEDFLEISQNHAKYANGLRKHEVCGLEIILEHIPKGIELILSNDDVSLKENASGIPSDLNALAIAKQLLGEKELIKSIFIPNYRHDSPLQPLNMIINSQLDADKLDYLRRDAYATGSEFGVALDVWRIVKNLAVSKNCLCIGKNALSAAESLVDSRYKAYRYIHTHHTKVQMDEVLRRAIHHGLEAGIFNVINKDGRRETRPFSAKYFGEISYDDAIGLFTFKYGTIDDHFIIQKIRDAKIEGHKRENIGLAKYYLEKLEKRTIHKSLWKVSDPLTIIEMDRIKKDKFRDSMMEYYKQDIDHHLSNIDRENMADIEVLRQYEENIRKNSVLCTFREIILRCQKEKKPPEKLEEKIIEWIEKKSGIEGPYKLSFKDVMVAQLIFDPYPIPRTKDERDRIMLSLNGNNKDLSLLSPEVRGLMLHWSVEKLFHGIYLFFSKELYIKMSEDDFLLKNLEDLTNYLETELFDSSQKKRVRR